MEKHRYKTHIKHHKTNALPVNGGLSPIINSAELSLAAYLNLIAGKIADQISNLVQNGTGLAQKQAEEFAKLYTEVITQYNDTDTSFSATVFKDVTGNLTLAIRGTA